MRKLILATCLVCSTSLVIADDHHDRHDDPMSFRIPKVFDAQGKIVGPLASFSGRSGVFLSINGALVLVPIIHRPRDATQTGLSAERSSSEFQWSDVDSVPYASADCSGTPLVPQTGQRADDSGPRPSIVVRQGVDVTVYVAAATYSKSQVTGSYRTLGPGSTSSCFAESPGNFTDPAWPSETAYPMTQHYPEPLRVSF